MFNRFVIGSVALALLSAGLVRADEPAKDPQIVVKPGNVMRLESSQDAPPKATANRIKASDYWIGVMCSSTLPDLLRSHLDIPRDQGVIVSDVVPDGPAAKAGIKQHDILFKAGGKPISSIHDLMKAVEDAKEGKLKIELVRGGKREKVTVTPVKRPADAQPKGHARTLRPDHLDWKAFQKMLEGTRPEDGMWSPRFSYFTPPGYIIPKGSPFVPAMPGNLSVTITREGSKPAEIVVKRDGKTWELTEKDLDKLPEDVRPHVKRMLGGGWPAGAKGRAEVFNWVPFSGTRSGAKPSKVRIEVQPKEASKGRLENRLEEMSDRIEQLRKSIEQLREKRPRRKGPEKDPNEA